MVSKISTVPILLAEATVVLQEEAPLEAEIAEEEDKKKLFL